MPVPVQEYRPHTSHSTTRYETEFKSVIDELWCFDKSFSTLVEAKARESLNRCDGIESRTIVVSETRRIAP